MDINNLKGLMEAYQQVNAPQEVDEATAMAKRGYDEAPIRQKIAKSTGGGETADRATKLADKSTFGDANKAKQRQNLARAQRGDFRKTTSSSPGLHGYAHKSDDPKVKAKQAARGAQRGALTPAEKKQLNREELDIFDVVLEFLQVEGYAETLEEAEWMMANVIDEEAIGIILGEAQLDEISQKTATRAFASRGTNEFESDGDDPRDFTKSGKSKADETKRRIEKKFGKKAGQHAERAVHKGIYGRKGVYSMPKVDEEYVDEAEKPFPYEKVKKKQVSLRDKGGNALDRRMQMGAAVRRAKEAEKTGGSQRDAGKGWYHAKEEYVDEAQHARENPEKYEREQAKKSAPVRGEKTPMPPRGDKRREDFEKWYAKQMGR